MWWGFVSWRAVRELKEYSMQRGCGAGSWKVGALSVRFRHHRLNAATFAHTRRNARFEAGLAHLSS